MTKEEIMQALARGYCADANAKKVLDSELIKSMADEVIKLQDKKHQIEVDKQALLWLRSQYLNYNNIINNINQNVMTDGIDFNLILRHLSVAMYAITNKYSDHKSFGLPDWDMPCLCDECKSY